MQNFTRFLVTVLVGLACATVRGDTDWVSLQSSAAATGDLTGTFTTEVPVQGYIESISIWTTQGTNDYSTYTNTITLATVSNVTCPSVTLLSYANNQATNVYPAIQEAVLPGVTALTSYRRYCVPNKYLTLTVSSANKTNIQTHATVIFERK